MTFFIYKITNIINNKIYIGKTNNPIARWKRHNKIAEGGPIKCAKSFYFIHAAICKYGKENFTFDIIEEFDNEDNCYKAEEFYINSLMSTDRNIGYNISNGGNGVMTNKPVSLETRKKISIAQKGIKKIKKSYFISDKSRKLMSFNSKNNKNLVSKSDKINIIDLFNTGEYTKKQIAEKFNLKFETIRFIINYYKNGFKTEEEKKINIKNRNAKKIGIPLSIKHKEKMSKALKGIIFTKERRENISKALTGRILPQEVKDKVAITLTGRSDYILIKKQIIDLFDTANYTRKELSEKFNLNQHLVNKIIRKHLIDKDLNND